MKRLFWTGLFVCMFLIGSVNAGLTYDIDDIEYIAGNYNSATIVIDFGPDSYYAFNYIWDPADAPTGFDSTVALDDGTDATLNVEYVTYSFGSMITDFDYTGAQKIDYVNNYGSPEETLGWGYYVSTDNENWTAPSWGANYYNIQDGDIVSWVWSNSAPEGHPDGWGTQYRGPGEEPMAIPVPEPATMAILAVGGLLLRAGRKK